jgi:DNA-binding MarR family transcriptional regulator
MSFGLPDYQVYLIKLSRGVWMRDNASQDLPMSRLLSLAYSTTSRAIFDRLTAAGIDDLRPSHGNVMEHLTFEEGLRLNDLAARAGVTPQTMGQWVDELEALGYVERRPDSSDRRAKRIHLTRKGKRSNEIAWKVVRDVESSLESLLGTKLMHDLRRALTKITGAGDQI